MSSIGVNPNKDHLRYVPGKGYQVQVWVPEDLRQQVAELAGKLKPVAQLTKYLDKTLPPPTRDSSGKLVYSLAALRAAAPFDAQFLGWIERARLGREVHVFVAPRSTNQAIIGKCWEIGMPHRMAMLPINTPGLVEVIPGSVYMLDEDAPETTLAEAVEVVDSEAIITLWATDPGKNSKPTYKAIKRKRAVIAQLFDFLEIPAIREFTDPRDDDRRCRTYRAFDLTKADADAIQRFKEETIPVAKQNDVLSHVAAIYNTAARERKFVKLPGGNPVKELYIPPKPKPEPDEEWEPFNENEADSLIEAALGQPQPAVKYTEILCAMLGTIISEIARRTVNDFKVDEFGNPYLDIPKGKTESRPRRLPLRWPILEQVGFVGYLESRRRLGPKTPLFDISPENTANRNRDFIAEILGEASENKKSNGWRKRFINLLVNLNQQRVIVCDDDRRRFVAGHSFRDPHADRYMRNPPHETKPILDALPVPKPLRLAEAVFLTQPMLTLPAVL